VLSIVRKRRQRLLVSFVVVSTAGLCTAAAGYAAACLFALRDARLGLAVRAARAADTAERNTAAAFRTLTAMNASTKPACSGSELAYFRQLIDPFPFMTDAGRMTRDGRVSCSAVIGRAAVTQASLQPAIVEPGGVQLYWDVPAFRSGDRSLVLMQLKSAFLVTDLQLLPVKAPAGVHLNVRVVGGKEPESRAGDSAASGVFPRGWQMASAGILSVTRCSLRNTHCVTASASINDALNADRAGILTMTAASGALGSTLGLIGTFFYRRNWSVERQFRRAIAKRDLELVYQPIVDLHTGRFAGAEALARWSGDDGQEPGSREFVQMMERGGFAGEMTRCVLCRTLEEFGPILRLHSHLWLSVNVTASDLSNSDFLSMIESEVEHAGLRPHNITIEVAEMSSGRSENVAETIRRLRQAGYGVAFDDFGASNSSLAYLNELEIDAIKISPSFIQSTGTGSSALAIPPQIMAMAATRNLRVIVEGVETAEQAAYFASTGTPILGQGGLLGRPAPVQAFAQALLVSPGMRHRGHPERGEMEPAVPFVTG
jgi:sensor c-di-GMP phosphodiesterase-like protein